MIRKLRALQRRVGSCDGEDFVELIEFGGFTGEFADDFRRLAQGLRDTFHRDRSATARERCPLAAVRMAPFHQLPLIAMAVIPPHLLDQFHFRLREIHPSRFLLQLDVVIHPVADAVRPACIRFALQSPGVDEVEQFARHWPVTHREIVAAHHRDAAPIE